MIRNSRFLSTLLPILIFLSIRCSQSVSGVETTNGATVVVREDKIEGTAPPFSYVFLFTADYIPYIDTYGLGVATASNEDGYYLFNKVKTDVFTVAIVSNDESRSAVIFAGNQDSSLYSELELPGSLEGSVSSSEEGPFLVFIYGTGYYVLLENSGPFVINGIPRGKYRIQAARIVKQEYPERPQIQTASDIQEIEMVPGKKTAISALVIP